MISEKANKKLLRYLPSPEIQKKDIETLTTLIVAPNVLIKDITRKGELVLKHLGFKVVGAASKVVI